MFDSKAKILVVDDMRAIRTLVRQVLSALRFSAVNEACDGAEAWTAIESASMQKTPYDLIISDWAMPKLSGLDLLKKVRMTDGVKNTPFLMITAESDSSQVKEAIMAGVSNYVTKPFTADLVKAKLEAIWKKHNP